MNLPTSCDYHEPFPGEDCLDCLVLQTLSFYATEDNWEPREKPQERGTMWGSSPPSEATRDRGAKARAVLQALADIPPK